MERAALSEMSLPALQARYDELCKEEAAREESIAAWTKKLADIRLAKGKQKVENSVDIIVKNYAADVRKSHDYIAARIAQLEIDAEKAKNIFGKGNNAIRVLTEQTHKENVKLRKIRDAVKIHLNNAKEQQAVMQEKIKALASVGDSFQSATEEGVTRLSSALDFIRQNLVAKNDSLDEKYEEMRAKNEEIQAEKKKKEDILEGLRNEVEQIRMTRSNFESEAIEAREESAVIQAQLDAQSAAKRERMEEQAELEAESARLKEDLEKLNKEHVAAVAEQAELQAQIEEELHGMEELKKKEQELEEDRTCEDIKGELEDAKAVNEERMNVVKRRTDELTKMLEKQRMKMEVTLEMTRWQMSTRNCQELEARRLELIRLHEQKTEQAAMAKDGFDKMMKEVEQAKQKLAAISVRVSEKRNDREGAEARERHLQRNRQEDFDTFKVNLGLAKRRREMAEKEFERIKKMPVGAVDEAFKTPVVLSRRKESKPRTPHLLRTGFNVEVLGSCQIPSLGCRRKPKKGFKVPEGAIDLPQPILAKKNLLSYTPAKETSKPPATPLKVPTVRQPAEGRATQMEEAETLATVMDVEEATGMGFGAEASAEKMDASCSLLELQIEVDTSPSTEVLDAANEKIQQWQLEPAGICNNSALTSERERVGIAGQLLENRPGIFPGDGKTPSQTSDSMQPLMQFDMFDDDENSGDSDESRDVSPRSISEFFEHLEYSPPPARQVSAPVPPAFMDDVDTSESDLNVSVWSQTGF